MKIETGTVLCRVGTDVPIPELEPFEVAICFHGLTEAELNAAALSEFEPVPDILEKCHRAVIEADKRLRTTAAAGSQMAQ